MKWCQFRAELADPICKCGLSGRPIGLLHYFSLSRTENGISQISSSRNELMRLRTLDPVRSGTGWREPSSVSRDEFVCTYCIYPVCVQAMRDEVRVYTLVGHGSRVICQTRTHARIHTRKQARTKFKCELCTCANNRTITLMWVTVTRPNCRLSVKTNHRTTLTTRTPHDCCTVRNKPY